MNTLQQQIESILPERLINAPRLERKLRELAELENIELVNHDYFGVTLPFELGSTNSIAFKEIAGQSQISITVNIY